MYQKTVIVGNLGRDPEMRYTESGKAVTTFNVATSRMKGKEAETTWFRVTTWDKTAENCNNYLKKGAKVLVEGYLQSDPQTGAPRMYEKKDGTFGTSFELVAQEVKFLSGKVESEEEVF